LRMVQEVTVKFVTYLTLVLAVAAAHQKHVQSLVKKLPKLLPESLLQPKK
jgi:hypothetical protein